MRECGPKSKAHDLDVAHNGVAHLHHNRTLLYDIATKTYNGRRPIAERTLTASDSNRTVCTMGAFL